jgi:hypothetical protein
MCHRPASESGLLGMPSISISMRPLGRIAVNVLLMSVPGRLAVQVPPAGSFKAPWPARDR